MRHSGLAALGMLVCLAFSTASDAQEERPNIVLILSDDHSFPYLGCYGQSYLPTPNFDRFAAEGIRFDRAFTGAPQCVPSRAVLLTGRSAVAARMVRFTSPLPRNEVTLADQLRAAGYYTGICGRTFHLDGQGRPGSVTGKILDQYDLRTFKDRVDFLDPGSGANQTEEKITQFLDQVPKGKPFFLWANFSDPHHAWDPKAAQPPLDPAKIEVPPYLPDTAEVRADLALYLGEVVRVDKQFQLVLDILEKRVGTRNTLIVFQGDNGMAFPHGKGSLYDPGLHVPLLVRWPAKVKPGQPSMELISGEDIAPTLLEAAGVKVPEVMSGHSFLPRLLGRDFQPRTHIFAERGPHGGATYNETTKANAFDLSRCVRSDRFKLIYNLTPHQEYAPVDSTRNAYWQAMVAAHEKGVLPPVFERAYFTRPRPVYELFDLEADPGELNNLAGKPELAEIERQLKIVLQEKMILDHDFLPLPLAE